jgi:UDP-N-acetylglucosamine diphosphorylase/glucosamine-1-phosphate N-acetyltransferase
MESIWTTEKNNSVLKNITESFASRSFFCFLQIQIQIMKHFCLFDDSFRDQLLPLTFTKPVSELRLGILSIREKWEKRINTSITSWKTQEYLNCKYPFQETDETVFLNGHVCPTKAVANLVSGLKMKQGIICGDRIIAVRTKQSAQDFAISNFHEVEWLKCEEELTILSNSWDLFTRNSEQIQADFELITQGRNSEPIPASCFVQGIENIFIEKGAKISFASLNASTGPIYIGTDSEIMEGALIRGPFVLGEHSVVNMGAKIYGPVSVGPFSKVGGELNTVNIQAFSNKGHDGFLGSSVIGEWCNLGADTNTSNLKNSYVEVKLWNYPANRFINTGLQFCGLIMGDHSKCGINTMFNAGTVVGVCCNIHGTGYPRNFVPSFSDGGSQGYRVNQTPEVFKTANRVMERRNQIFTPEDQKILAEVFEQTKRYRKY